MILARSRCSSRQAFAPSSNPCIHYIRLRERMPAPIGGRLFFFSVTKKAQRARRNGYREQSAELFTGSEIGRVAEDRLADQLPR